MAAFEEGFVSYLYKKRLELVIIAALLVVAAGVIHFMWPLIDGIVLGVFFAYVTRPVKDLLSRHTKYSPYIATFCVVLPLLLIILYSLWELKNQVVWLSANGEQALNGILSTLQSLGLPQEILNGIDDILKNLTGFLVQAVGDIPLMQTFSRLLLLAMNAIVSLFVCFYLLKDGDKAVRSLLGLFPDKLRPPIDHFTNEADRILFGIYIGTFYTALFIAAMSAMLFAVFQVPYPILCTAFVFIAAMVPILSGMMVFLPLTLYEYAARGPGVAALFLGTAIVLVYIPPDFIIRPFLISKASNLHPLLIILSFIGGGLAGGLTGFFLAPLMMGLLVAAYRTYQKFGVKQDESVH